MAKMSDDQLIGIIRAHRRNSLGSHDTDLNNQRAEAMDRYYGRPYGDEVDGKSQIVSKDLSETVDWIMPAIMESLMQGGELAEFQPESEEDEQAAIQETSLVNHVIMKDNNGFMILYDAIRDALLLKNGYFKHYWNEDEKIIEREYEGLTQDELVKLFYDLKQEGAEVEVIEQEENTKEIAPGVEIPVFTVELKITKKKNRVTIEAVPPEELRISKQCRGSLQTSPFTEHVTTLTRTELIEMGMDSDFVNNLPSYGYDENADSEEVEDARDSLSEEDEDYNFLKSDKSMDDIEYCETYIKVDYDGDGKAELRKVVTVANQLPPGDEWNEMIDTVAITGCTGKRVPHRHIGESLHDDLYDLARIKTFLQRQLFDNIYATNNIETIVNNRVNLADFLQSIPGGVKRIKDDMPVGDAVMYPPVQPIADKILPAIDYIDRTKATRTGISDVTTVQDPNVLRDSTNAAFQSGLQQAGQKVRMIERMLVESGIKDLVLRVHELLVKHQDQPRTIKIAGNYTQVNPTMWRERTNLHVKVGLGTGTKDEQRANLGIIQELLTGLLAPMGLVTPQKAFNMFSEVCKTLNIVSPDKYAVEPDPKNPEWEQLQQAQQAAAQQQGNPLADAEQVRGMMNLEIEKLKGQFKIESEQQQLQFNAVIDGLKRQHETELGLLKAHFDAQQKEADRLSKEAIEAGKLEVQAMIKGIELDIGQPGVGAGIQEGQ